MAFERSAGIGPRMKHAPNRRQGGHIIGEEPVVRKIPTRRDPKTGVPEGFSFSTHRKNFTTNWKARNTAMHIYRNRKK
jgi:hypothetical protein